MQNFLSYSIHETLFYAQFRMADLDAKIILHGCILSSL